MSSPLDSRDRAHALELSGLLDSPIEPAFDRLTAMAASLLDAPMSMISIIEHDRQFFKSSFGLESPWAERRETPLSHCICQHVVAAGAPLAIEDARIDPLVCDNLEVPELGVVAYLGYPLRSEDGTVLGCLAVVDRIPRRWTKREHAAMEHFAALAAREMRLSAALRGTEAKLRALLSQVPVVLWTTDRDLRMTGTFGAALDWLEPQMPNGGIGLAIPAVFGNDETHPAVVAHHRALEGQSASYELLWGSSTLHAFVEPLRSEGQEIVGTVGVSVDYTERRRAELALQASERRYHSLFELNPNAAFSFDVTGIFLSANPACGRLTGYTPAELVGMSFDPVIIAEDRDRARAIFAGAVGGDTQRWELGIAHRSGRTVLVRGVTVPIRESGQIVGVYGVGEDVTTQRHLDEQLRIAQRMEAVGRLAGGIAHDFNNLLTTIRGYSEMLVQGAPAGSVTRADAEQIVEAADRAAVLTRQLLAFSRRQLLRPRPLLLQTALHDAEKLIRHVLGADVRLDLAPGNAGAVLADPGQVEQVLMNLVMNARDAMPNGGRLRIAIEEQMLSEGDVPWALQHGAYVALTITDTGVGMTDEVRSHLFEPFYTTKPLGKGTGLGLATVYGIVKQSGGHVLVTSAPGAGTTIRVLLPRVESAPEESAPVDTGAAPCDGAGTVLIAEDEPAVRSLAAKLLARCGYTVLIAANGADALAMAASEKIDLLLTDVVMPGMNGPELVERLRKTQPGVGVVFMSGYTSDDVARRGIASQSTAFLQKPFTAATLLAKVSEALPTKS